MFFGKQHLLLSFLSCLPMAASAALSLSQTPLFIGSTEPRIMLLMSRDHELSRKAYTDYTDLNGDGTLDTTYLDSVNYYGYFDSDKCYTYSTANSRFEPSEEVEEGTHECDGSTWSGNFLNWGTMTRLDVVRKVLYGGFRSTDNTGTALGATVLERAFLPYDVHAFAKVYAPNGSSGNGTLVNKYTPYSPDAGISLCNVSDAGDGVQSGSINTVNGSNTSPAPLVKVASGAWTQWAMTEILQCKWKEDFSAETSPTRPTKASNRLTGSNDLVARVAVCAPGQLEDKCKSYYTRAATPVQTIKPIGLLQQYGDVDAERRTRFGLMTGSYKNNASGGVLRKNIKLFANNSNISNTSTSICGDNNDSDEVDVCTGQFINQSLTYGIVNTLNRIHIAGYKTPASGAITSTNVCHSGFNQSAPFACSASSLLSGTNGTCVDWGNPLGEMYHEALRYFAGKSSATAGYSVNDGSATAVISNLGIDTWNPSSDPLPSSEWCALSNIIVLSTGLTSLDNATITTDISGLDPVSLTNAVGTEEGLAGNYLIGSNGTISNNICSSKILTNLAAMSGICPELPHMKGGYLITGLANSSRSLDLRPEYLSKRTNRWSGINMDWVNRQPLGTYTVGLAENLPSLEVAVGSGKVNIVPTCRSGGSTNCSMTDLRVESYSATAASFLVSWEDNSAGSDHDMDTIARLIYCVGSACSPNIASDKIKITIYPAQSATGSSMELGYTVSGTSSDGTIFPISIPGTATCNPTDTANASNQRFFSLLSTPFSSRPTSAYTSWPTCPAPYASIKMPTGIVNATTGCPASDNSASNTNCGCPKDKTYTQSTTAAGLLKNPLWYTAKYGTPASSWDVKNNTTSDLIPDGIPDNFFNVRNPATLYDSLATVFDRASQPDGASASVATNSTNLKIKSRIYQAKFSSVDWSGQLLAYRIETDGSINTAEEWDAGELINNQVWSDRVIYTQGVSDGDLFKYDDDSDTSIKSSLKAYLDKDQASTTDNCGPERVAYLRGDLENEGSSGTFTCETDDHVISKFRKRKTSVLGDTVNSNPLYVGAPSAGYSETEQPGYSQFRQDNKNRKPVVYVGANDGMLHGFDASLDFSSNEIGIPTSTSGSEVVAYVPSQVYPNLSRLTASTYNKDHRYFVDGSPMSADVQLSSTWKTVLVGGLAGGGKGFYALDITHPSSFANNSTDASNVVLWEFQDGDTGYAYNLPPTHLATNQAKQIVKMANGKWAAIIGNGYNSSSGKAMLYILFIEDGLDGSWTLNSDYKAIQAGTDTDNGLSTPVPFDSDNDGYVDVVYAGDLKGNIWKFLVGPSVNSLSENAIKGIGTNPGTWTIGLSNQPLFTAKNSSSDTQAIVSPPEVVSHPYSGQFILFGTGKYIESSDTTSTTVQSFYGIWDKDDGTTTIGARSSALLKQEISTTPLTEAGGLFRSISQNQINWRTGSGSAADCTAPCTPTHLGWYIDLPDSKERTTGIPKYINKVIFFNTLIPSSALCDAGGTGWLMSVDVFTGGLVDNHSIYDTDNDGQISGTDLHTAGVQVGSAIGGTTLIQNIVSSIQSSTTSNTGIGVSALSTGAIASDLINFGGDNIGRTSWQEIRPQ